MRGNPGHFGVDGLFRILFLWNGLWSIVYGLHFTSVSFPLLERGFYHLSSFSSTLDRPQGLALFAKEKIVFLNLDGEVITTFPFALPVIEAIPCSSYLYLITNSGIYRLRFDKVPAGVAPEGELVEKRAMIDAFPIGSYGRREEVLWGFVSKETVSIFLFRKGPTFLFSLPIPNVFSGCRKERDFYFACSQRIYKFDPQEKRLEEIFSLPDGEMKGVFNLGDRGQERLYCLFKKSDVLYLGRLDEPPVSWRRKSSKRGEERKKLFKWMPVMIAAEGDIVGYEAPPFIFLKVDRDLYSIFPSGHLEKITGGERIIDWTIQDLNQDGFFDLGLLSPTRVEIFFSQGREILLKRERARELFFKGCKKGRWEQAERAFLAANIFNDQIAGEEAFLWSVRKDAYTNYYLKRVLFFSLTLSLIILPVIFALFYLKKRGGLSLPGARVREKRLQERSFAEICHLTLEVITLDHNFIVKGNIPAALKKLQGIRQDYRLSEELPDGWDEDIYKNFLTRLIAAMPKKPLISFVEERLEEVGMDWRDKNCVTIAEEAKGVILGIDRTMENIFSHIFSDHFRHAKISAEIKITYLLPTEWARKVKFSFLSDAEKSPNLKEGHLAEDLRTLSFRYGNYIAYGEGKTEREKLWVTLLDIVGIINGILGR